ncbi:MAG: archease [Candidatus Uhrbacteria bacterium]|nr:archease [Patescibacteria group bacterium]MBU1907491.1 archease [Patescibacteria group bacterium]
MRDYEMKEHTGDIKMSVSGKSLEELFANAARGMMSFIYGEAALQCKADQTEEILISSADQPSLLVEWLSELLYLSDTNRRAYVRFDVGQISETQIKASVGSCPAVAQDDIKAVTYHELAIEKNDRRFEATIIFDV